MTQIKRKETHIQTDREKHTDRERWEIQKERHRFRYRE